MTRWSLAVIPMLALVFSAAPAHAQFDPLMHLTAAVEVTPAPDLIDPITGLGRATFEVAVGCDASSLPPLHPIDVYLHVSADRPYVQATLSPKSYAFAFEPTDCLTGTKHQFVGTVDMTFSKDAPAYEAVRMRLRAETPYAQAVETEWMQQADVYFRSAAQFERSQVRVAPGDTFTLPLSVQNIGNGATAYRFTLHEESSDQLSVSLPNQLIVPPFGEHIVAGIEVSVPADTATATHHPIHLIVQGASADNPAELDAPMQVSAVILVDSEGTNPLPEELPAPNVVLPMLLVVALAALLRRRS